MASNPVADGSASVFQDHLGCFILLHVRFGDPHPFSAKGFVHFELIVVMWAFRPVWGDETGLSGWRDFPRNNAVIGEDDHVVFSAAVLLDADAY